MTPPPTVEGKNHPDSSRRTDFLETTPPPTVEGKNHPPLQPLKAKSALGTKSGPPKSRNRPPLQPLKAKSALTPKSGTPKSEKERPKKGLFLSVKFWTLSVTNTFLMPDFRHALTLQHLQDNTRMFMSDVFLLYCLLLVFLFC